MSEMFFTKKNVNVVKATEKAYLEKLHRNRAKAAKAKKPYWQARIDAFFLNGVMK